MDTSGRLRATFDRLETDESGEGLAVLVFDDGQQLVIPVRFLPSGALVHQVVAVDFEIDQAETARRVVTTYRLQQELFGE